MKKHKERARRKSIVFAGVILAIIMVTGTVAAFIPTTPSNNNNDTTEEIRTIINQLSNPALPNASGLGNANANITIVEFGNYQCPGCAQFHRESRDQIITNLVNTGQVKFLFKDLITDDAVNSSTVASSASYCAAEQGKYWDYHKEIYDNYRTDNSEWLSKSNLKQFANNIRIGDLLEFSRCVDSNKYANIVMENSNLAQSIGLSSPPNFLIISNNSKQPILIQGPQPYNVFLEAITMIKQQ